MLFCTMIFLISKEEYFLKIFETESYQKVQERKVLKIKF